MRTSIYRGTPNEPTGESKYHAFWRSLLHSQIQQALPALITFNYDLVLERTLWEYFHFLDFSYPERRNESVSIKYNFGHCDFTIRGERHRYNLDNHNYKDGEIAVFDWKQKAEIEIPYLKPHGSLNWGKSPTTPVNEQNEQTFSANEPTMAVEEPLILPPVFNKMNSLKINAVWKAALDVLRNAKNIIIVGYSLPKTDIYMQYFLKSAVGPNSNLQKIIVFDPILFRDNEQTSEMKQRYEECFSPQFSGRIIFNPRLQVHFPDPSQLGSFYHFVETLRTDPKYLFFYP
jgi:hypothetical protein